MILGANLVQKRNEIDPHPPSNRLPIQAHSSEFGGLWTLIAIRRDCPNGDDASINERENKVSRCHLSHEFIKRVSRSVGIALRRPEITALDLLSICLVLVYPPVAHVASILPETPFRLAARAVVLNSRWITRSRLSNPVQNPRQSSAVRLESLSRWRNPALETCW